MTEKGAFVKSEEQCETETEYSVPEKRSIYENKKHFGHRHGTLRAACGKKAE